MQLFYSNTLQHSDEEFIFSREESKHITKVLRKKEGETLYITNGLGWLFNGIISLSTPNRCVVKIEKSVLQPKRSYQLHMAVAPTKMNDRFEWFLEKATEIGIDQITPIICDRSERKLVKHERFERILQSAMKQSLQCYLPKLNASIPFSKFIATHQDENMLIAHCEEGEKDWIQNIIESSKNTIILIGPEGDFSENEISIAKKYKAKPITLGQTRLRTETAAIVAVHSVSLLNNVL